MQPKKIAARWSNCIVAATGPSLTEEVAEACRGHNIIAVNDAYRRMPFAQVLYACDAAWWEVHNGCADHSAEKWSSHGDDIQNNKIATAEKYGLHLVAGRKGDGFSLDPAFINYGENSGFQAINLAILFGCTQIVLVGFDMRGDTHFFGAHPARLGRPWRRYDRFIPIFETAAKKLPPHIQVINCTPDSALTCFPSAELSEKLTGLSSGR